ncbi:permease [Candidatus Riflebacteria bacterium]
MNFYLLLAETAQAASSSAGYLVAFKNALFEVGRFLSHYLVGGMIPAFFIAGALGSFIPKEFILKYLGKNASPWLSFPVSVIAGGILSVCSCGIIPLFVGIYTTGAGIGPAISFLFAGPAINLVAIFYTQAIISTEMMLVRTSAAAIGALVCGLIFKMLFTEPEQVDTIDLKIKTKETRTGLQTIGFMALLLFIMLVGSNPGKYLTLYMLVGIQIINLCLLLFLTKRWLNSAEIAGWLDKTWFLFKNIMPKIVIGIFATQFILALVPVQSQIIWLMERDDFSASFFASLIGSFVYFGTIVGVNIVHAFQQWGLGNGPALALFLAGPVVSLPSLLPISGTLGIRRTAVYWLAVVLVSTLLGFSYAKLAPLFPAG